jgi:hypothetical protein
MSLKQEWFTDTQKTDNQFFTLQNFERSDRIHNWDYSESAPIFKNETISIYDTFNWSSGREGFIIETKENILIIQVTEDTRTREKVLYCLDNSESMKMKLFAGCGVNNDGNECDMYQDTEIQSVEILLSGCLLILNYDDDLKIFIDEFDHKSLYDGLNSRLNDISLKSISDPESSDEYNQPFGNCNTIQFTKVETSFYEHNCDYYRTFTVYQLLEQGIRSVLVIKEYEIKFTNIYEKQKISKSQVHFSLPKFPCLNFDDIQTIDSSDDTYTLIIYYKDTIKKDFLMTLQIIKDYSKVMNISDTYDDSYYIFRSSLDKIQIYPSYYVKTTPSWKKLIGIIDFDNDNNENDRFKDMFVKAHLTRR